MPAAAKTRSILVEHYDGSKTQISDIPANAKITLGPVSMGKSDYSNRDMALRIYTTAGNQLAVFRNVTSFRDLALTIHVEEVTVEADEFEQCGPDGGERKSNRKTSRRMVPIKPLGEL